MLFFHWTALSLTNNMANVFWKAYWVLGLPHMCNYEGFYGCWFFI